MKSIHILMSMLFINASLFANDPLITTQDILHVADCLKSKNSNGILRYHGIILPSKVDVIAAHAKDLACRLNTMRDRKTIKTNIKNMKTDGQVNEADVSNACAVLSELEQTLITVQNNAWVLNRQKHDERTVPLIWWN